MNAPAQCKIEVVDLFDPSYNEVVQPKTYALTQPNEDIDDKNDETDKTVTRSFKPYHGSKGFVPVSRAVFNGVFFVNYDYKRFFWLMDLYAMASFEDGCLYAPNTSTTIPLKRGQIMTSWNILKRRWRLPSDKPVRTFLARAEQDRQITQKRVLMDGTRIPPGGEAPDHSKRVLCSVITICNYDSYRSKAGGKDGDGLGADRRSDAG